MGVAGAAQPMGAERDESGAGAAVLVPLLGFRSNRPAGPAEKMAVAGSGWSLARVAEALGSSEQALRLIVSILMGKGGRGRELRLRARTPQSVGPLLAEGVRRGDACPGAGRRVSGRRARGESRARGPVDPDSAGRAS